MGDGGSRGADSYIGSVISLTSKSEIRYEGILYTVDTENSNIALQNVRSFGTEGRKKEGPQITASDKVYEYIIFRGSDIKDLQVKSSPPVQAPSQPHSDPAIISLQAPYSQSPLMPPVYRPALGISSDQNSSLSFPGVPAAGFRNGVPALYQPAPAMGPWGPLLPPPGANGTGLAMPMYWPGPGFYRTQTGQAHVQQQHQLPHSIPLPPLQPQPLIQPLGQTLLPTVGATTSSHMLQPLSDASENLAASVPAAASPSYPLAMSFGTTVTSATSVVLSSVASTSASLTSLPQGISAIVTPASKISRREFGLVHPSQLQSQYSNTISTTTSSSTIEYDSKVSSPLQKTSLGQHASGLVSVIDKSPISNVQVHKQEQKLAEPLQSASQLTPSTSLSMQHQPPSQPLLPLPTASAHQRYMHQGNGTMSHSHHIRRGRGRGRLSLVGHQTQHFMEEFDFTAMNEKFNKDEVWGKLGKGDTREKVLDNDEDCGDGDVEDAILESASAPNKSLHDQARKPVYTKDDFFDSLSCDALNHGEGRAERPKFSEQLKIDTETFGSFPTRSHGGRGSRSISRRGSYRGGYYGGHSIGGKGTAQGRGHGVMPSSNAM